MAKTRASRNSVHAHRFSQVPQAKIPRSSFDRSHSWKGTLDAGWLIPILVDEVLPGDTHSCRASLFGRLATPLKPIFDNIFMDTFFFFVPNRLVWDNWAKFNGEQTNPADSIDYNVPQTTITPSEGDLADYFGLPVGNPISVSAFPFRAYRLIWDEWFRDQNLQNSVSGSTGDGPDAFGGTIYRRGKRHDYFTSCLPWPQKGDAVTVPLGQTADIHTAASDVAAPLAIYSATEADWRFMDASLPDLSLDTVTAGNPTVQKLYADLSTATGFTINQLRQSFQIQKLLERDARGGTRYIEIIRSHFGVVSPDARLQRPEFLGGGTSMVNINPVASTSWSDVGQGAGTVVPQAHVGAYGTVSASNHGFTKSFTEHGTIIGLVSFRADLTYQQGMERMWSRSGRYDFYWPALSHIGEQAVLNKEIYYQNNASDDTVFGYQERYAEYRYKPSRITGAFRSNAAAPLDVWHLGQDFSTLPVLGDTFIQENPPIDRISAVATEPNFMLDVYFRYRSVRPMPLYGVPGLIDHF